MSEKFEIKCEDGVVLRGRLLIPPSPKAVIQFNCGTAARKEFYLPFLEYLSDNQYVCCLWDYRGNGDSAPENLKNCEYSFLDYGLKDIPTVKRYLRNRFPDLPYLIIGHSAGGQQVGFTEDLSDVKGMIGFAVSVGYRPFMPLHYRLLTLFFFYMFSPVSIALTGYVRAKKFGIMEDLPRNVLRQWRDWCSKSDYFFDQQFYEKNVPRGNFKNYDFPIEIYWTSDDTISTERAVHSYWKNIENKKTINFNGIKPENFQMKQIGHFGFFRRSLRDKLWPDVVQKLNSFLD